MLARTIRTSWRGYATEARLSHDILILGGGTAGLNAANMIKSEFERNGHESPRISLIDKAELHQ